MTQETERAVAIVTGASRGIGRAIARRLAARYDIVAAARSRTELATLADEIAAAGGRCTPVVVDLTDPGAIAAAFGGLDADVLVNNAGVGVLRPLMELSPDAWRTMVAVNVDALYHVTRAVLPGMLRRARGHVVVIGSIAGRSAFAGGTCYAATKHAAMAFAECLMLEVRDQGVKVSIVNPGSVDTAFGAPRDSAQDTRWKLTAADVAESVWHVIDTPPDVLVHRVEVRARAPTKR